MSVILAMELGHLILDASLNYKAKKKKPMTTSKSYKPTHGGYSLSVCDLDASSNSRDLDIKNYGKYYEASFGNIVIGRFLNENWIKPKPQLTETLCMLKH